MVIYGVALLSICALAGLVLGEVLGRVLGVEANVGGVGIAMLMLIFSSAWLIQRGLLSAPSQRGIEFWSAVYVPIVVGMAAQQNVIGAIAGGPTAILSGFAAVAIGFALVPVITGKGEPDPPPAAPGRAVGEQVAATPLEGVVGE
jgi:malonate transporter MadL subunit